MMKYIVFRSQRAKLLRILHPVIFPNNLVHADVALAMTAPGAPLAGYAPDSAGDISLFDGDFICGGSSETLKLTSKPARDTHLIKMNDYGAGMN